MSKIDGRMDGQPKEVHMKSLDGSDEKAGLHVVVRNMKTFSSCSLYILHEFSFWTSNFEMT